MTLLATIKEHQLHLTCGLCGHIGRLEVTTLLEAGHRAWRVEDVKSRAKCSRCGARKIANVTISWAGNSHQAMRGSDERKTDGDQ